MGFNWLAAAVAALFAFLIIKGYRKGFLRIAVSLAGMLAVMAGAMIISPGISSSLINGSRIYDDIEKKLIESFNKRIEAASDASYDKDSDTDIISGFRSESYDGEEDTISAEDYGIPQIIMDDIMNEYGTQLRNEIASTLFERFIAGYITKLIIKASTFIIVSAILSVGVWFVLKTTSLISRIPVIKGFNRTLGCITGALEALIITWVSFFIIIMCLGNSFGIRMFAYIKDSAFLSFLFSHNILFNIFRGN